jgi:hypothetical protein
MKQGGITPAAPSRRLLLLRYHHRVAAMETLRYRIALRRGQVYEPKVRPTYSSEYTHGAESERPAAEG